MAEEVLVPKYETTQHLIPEHNNLDVIMGILNVVYVSLCSFVTMSEGCV